MIGFAKMIKALIAPWIGPGIIIIGLPLLIATPVTLPRSNFTPWKNIFGLLIELIAASTRSYSPTDEPPIVKEIPPNSSTNFDIMLLCVSSTFPDFTYFELLVSSLPVDIMATLGLLKTLTLVIYNELKSPMS